MVAYTPDTLQTITHELELLFDAHEAVGLTGKMALRSAPDQQLWRAKEAGIALWFGREEIPQVVEQLATHYNQGNLPNTPLLLNPIIHEAQADGSMKPLGSGVVWCTAFCLGVSKLQQEQMDRVTDLGVLTSPFHRGENDAAGLKMLAFSKNMVPVSADNFTVASMRELYNIAFIQSGDYAPYYLLSGLDYLCTHGLFGHPGLHTMLHEGEGIDTPEKRKALIAAHQIDHQRLIDASLAWDAYDHHHSLYNKFGTNTDDIENNLKFFNLCARDIQLFDATGVRHTDADTHVGFDFLVEGWIPKGAVTVIGASGGTGKSSLAHNLAVKAAIDWRDDEPAPTWLGSKINVQETDGIIVYLSGEDGPAIVHARAQVYDPDGRSHRLMMMRTDFGDGVTLSGFLKRLHSLPKVPLIVIDPARKYLTGDENDAGVVSEFFEAIEEFAIQKHSAVVVVHHLAKGAKPQHVLDIYDLLRGSQVFIDRPRVVIGMYREGPYVVAGLAKNNIPPQLGMVMGECVYARDGEQLELVKLPGEKGHRGQDLTPEQLEEIEEAKNAG